MEIDGPEHCRIRDAARDEDDWKTSGIIVLRVKNFHEKEMDLAIAKIKTISPWLQRRKELGILTPAQKRSLKTEE